MNHSTKRIVSQTALNLFALSTMCFAQSPEETVHKVNFRTSPQSAEVYLDTSGSQSYEKFLGLSSKPILLDLAAFQESSGFTVVFRREGYFDKRERISTGYFNNRSVYPEMGSVSLAPKHWSIPLRDFAEAHRWGLGAGVLLLVGLGVGWGLRRKAGPGPQVSNTGSDPWLGRIVGDYRLQKFIGEGGSSRVYLGLSKDGPEVQVAVKILRTDVNHSEEVARRFHREASLYRGLQHGHIVSLVDWGELDGHHYLITDYIPGESLAHLVFRQGALAPERALEYMQQAAEALSFAHRAGVSHRDVKPENLQLSQSGKVKLMDFGLARSAASSFTQSGQALGTPAYMAPEQIRALEVDFRCDQYGLGAVGYFLLTGDRPFKDEGDGTAPILFQQLNHDPKPTRECNPAVPERLSALVAKLMQRNPDQRFTGMDSVLEEMKAISDEMASS